MIQILGWATLIGVGLYFHIIQTILIFTGVALSFVAAILGGGIITINLGLTRFQSYAIV